MRNASDSHRKRQRTCASILRRSTKCLAFTRRLNAPAETATPATHPAAARALPTPSLEDMVLIRGYTTMMLGRRTRHDHQRTRPHGIDTTCKLALTVGCTTYCEDLRTGVAALAEAACGRARCRILQPSHGSCSPESRAESKLPYGSFGWYNQLVQTGNHQVTGVEQLHYLLLHFTSAFGGLELLEDVALVATPVEQAMRGAARH